MANSSLPNADVTAGRIALLADIATRLLMHDRPEEIAQHVFASLAEHLDLDFFVNYLVSRDGSHLELLSSAGLETQQTASIRTLRFNQAVCGTVAARRERIVVGHVQASSDAMSAQVRRFGARAYACHPLLGGQGRLVGTLSFGSRSRDDFTDDELEVMQTVANQVAVAIERAHALAEAQRHIEERRLAEGALRRSE